MIYNEACLKFARQALFFVCHFVSSSVTMRQFRTYIIGWYIVCINILQNV